MNKTPIAIIGIGCRFSGVNNHHELWDLLRQGKEAIAKNSPPSSEKNLSLIKHLKDVDRFDADFFNILPETAILMDPQQRLLLEMAWETLEDAGQVPQDLAGSNTGIFIGINSANYSQFFGVEEKRQFEAITGNQLSIAANRLSYFFDFQGVSMAMDTACSSSLLAVDRACRSLWTEESDLALAGGINLILTNQQSGGLTQAGLMGADGRCKVFDGAADGYGRSDGIGLILLKPLAQAQADGDRIYAVIRGSSVNHNGRSNGLTAPNLQAQVNLLTKAYQQADIDPASVHYVEAHATGTLIGDALELKAIGRVLGKGRSPNNLCHVGSIKTNIGHTETASGIAGLIKTALIAYHRQIPPHLHLQHLNPSINLAKLGLNIPQTLEPITDGDRPFILGVSAFGFGGTNVHTILQSPPAISINPSTARFPVQIFLLSAKTQTALRILVQQYQTLCQQQPAPDLEILCANVNTNRAQFSYRFCTVIASLSDLEQALQLYLDQTIDISHNKILGDRTLISKVSQRQRQKSLLTAAQDIIDIPKTLTEDCFIDATLLTEIFLNFCTLWSEGYSFDWHTLYPRQHYPRLSLPSYPFERQSFWVSQLPSQEIQPLPELGEKWSPNTTLIPTEITGVMDLRTTFVPPQTDLEKQLVTIWQKTLKVPDIGIEDNFFDLGGNSKLSLQLVEAIATQLQYQFPLTALFELSTIAKQADLIEQKSSVAIHHTEQNSTPIPPQFQPEEYRNLLAIVAGRRGKRHHNDALIVGLNTETAGTQQPFFFCANSYAEAKPLATALGKEQPFYLMESGYIPFRVNDKHKIKALAKQQLKEIIQIQPEPPYAIGGYSFGTMVAYEVAQQLIQMKKEVNLLVIFDHPGHHEKPLSLLYPGQLLNRLQNYLSQKNLPKKENNPYRFQPYSEKLTLFFARQSFRNFSSGYRKVTPLWLTPRAGWPTDIVPNLEIHLVPGDHFSMLHEPHVQILAQKLKTCFND